MKYKSQQVAYWFFFALCMLLFTLQIVYGFIMGLPESAWMDFMTGFLSIPQGRFIPIYWLFGYDQFMGAAYYIIRKKPKGTRQCKLAYVQLISLAVVGVVAITGYHLISGKEEISPNSRELDYLVV